MDNKRNCWEMMKCGREFGGAHMIDLGVCPAALDTSANGINGGRGGGRICWAVVGTFCGGKVQGTFAEKAVVCTVCAFFKQVKDEEGAANFKFLKPGQVYRPSVR